MRKTILSLGTLTVFVIMFSISCDNTHVEKKDSGAISNDSLIKHGEYLVKVMGCSDCHSPKNFGPQGPEIDMERSLSGYPSSRPIMMPDTNVIKKGWMLFNGDLTQASGPWGISFAANITSDSTGIGAWTEEQFKKAITQGKYKGLDNTRSILPPMPWQNFRNLKDEDIKAIFYYLKSTKPVKNVVPAAQIAGM